MKPIFIEATTLSDAWFQALDAVMDHGRVWTVDHGSYIGQDRWELDYVTIHVKDPGARPLIPEIPPGLAIPPPVSDEYVEDYLPYLMTDHREPGEQYTYGERLKPQMEEIIRRYKKHGFGSNQECIAIAKPEDIMLDDPPCLRQIDTRIYKDECREGPATLHFVCYFRSWDLWGGFPANLAGIRLVQEYMALEIGVEAGEMIVASKGLHIYDHAWDVAKIRTAR